MAGQAPGTEPKTVKVPPEHRGARLRKMTSLFCECIPDTCPEVEEVGPAGIGYIHQIDASNTTHSDRERGRRARGMKAEARTGFHEIGPVLLLHIEVNIAAPESLHLKTSQRRGESDLIL